MKNIQIVDDADNATFSIFQATDEEFAALFPDGRDMALARDLEKRLGTRQMSTLLTPIWSRPILKRDAMGIHGTLFYVDKRRAQHLPASGREIDWDDRGINTAQRQLFARARKEG